MANFLVGTYPTLPAKKLVSGFTSATYALNRGAASVNVVMSNMQAMTSFDWTGREFGRDTDATFYPLAWTRSNISIGGSNVEQGRLFRIPNVIVYNDDPFGTIAQAVTDLATSLEALDVFATLPQLPFGQTNDQWMTTSLYQTGFSITNGTIIGLTGTYGTLIKSITTSDWAAGNVLEIIAMSTNHAQPTTVWTTGYVLHFSEGGNVWKSNRSTNVVTTSKTLRNQITARFNKIKTLVLWYDPPTTGANKPPTNFPSTSIRLVNEAVTDEVADAEWKYCGLYTQAPQRIREEARSEIASFFGL